VVPARRDTLLPVAVAGIYPLHLADSSARLLAAQPAARPIDHPRNVPDPGQGIGSEHRDRRTARARRIIAKNNCAVPAMPPTRGSEHVRCTSGSFHPRTVSIRDLLGVNVALGHG
jgi:hypothetical protein